MSQSENYPMIAKTMAELEDVLADELIALGASDVEIGTRMVSFTGDKALMYKANVHCRTALRILKPIYQFKAGNADEVYEAIKSINWENYLTVDKTFSIDSVVFSHIFKHSKFVAYRVKDAIADWFQERYNKRPSVSLTNPDIVFNIHVAHNKCTLSLDSSGESLHKRGYRISQTEAPLNEVLAAGMILKSGWRGESNFVDPMCGSGTILIEAAMIATGTPPGIHRQDFGFEKWNDFDEELFSEIYNDDSGTRDFDFRIIGSDVSVKAIDAAEQNVKNAGMKKYIDLTLKAFQKYDEAPKPVGVLMTNPPYGERLKVDELDELYAMIGERLKHVFVGYDSYVLSYKKELFDMIGLKPSKRFFLFNGALECEMRQYEIFEGKRVERDPEDRPAIAVKRERRADKFSSQERNSREGYRRSRREFDSEEPSNERREFQRKERTPRDGRERGFDRKEQGSFNRDRKPRDFSRRDSDREFKPRDFQRRDSDAGRKPFDRDRKPFDKDRKPYDRDRRPFSKDHKSFDRGERPNIDKKHFDKSEYFDRGRNKTTSREQSFDRGERKTEYRERSFDKDRRPKDRSFDKDRRPRDFKSRNFDRGGDKRVNFPNKGEDSSSNNKFKRDRIPRRRESGDKPSSGE